MDKKLINKAKRRAIYYYDKGGRYYDEKHNTYNPASYAENILQHVSDLLDCCGVEYLHSDNDSWNIPAGYSYVNTGETYDLTLMYDHKKRRFLVSSWGDIAETFPYETY
jgi:hypothetical protein